MGAIVSMSSRERALDCIRMPRTLLGNMVKEIALDRLRLLREVSFGAQVAEEETSELTDYFVETDQWLRIAGQRGKAQRHTCV